METLDLDRNLSSAGSQWWSALRVAYVHTERRADKRDRKISHKSLEASGMDRRTTTCIGEDFTLVTETYPYKASSVSICTHP